MRALHTVRHSRRRNPRQELRVHGTIPARPTRPAQKAEMSTIPRTYHLYMGWQGDIIEHVGINQGIIAGARGSALAAMQAIRPDWSPSA